MSVRADGKRSAVGSGVDWEEKYGYSRAVRVGDHIYVSGTTATDADGPVAPGDPAGQARFALDKIEKAIRDLGGTLGDVVRTRIYIARMDDWETVARVHGEKFGKIRPANTLVRADPVGEEYLVEIEAEAVVGSAAEMQGAEKLSSTLPSGNLTDPPRDRRPPSAASLRAEDRARTRSERPLIEAPDTPGRGGGAPRHSTGNAGE